MDNLKAIFAFAITLVALLAIVVLMAIGSLSSEVGLPIITLAVGAAVGYLFPSPL